MGLSLGFFHLDASDNAKYYNIGKYYQMAWELCGVDYRQEYQHIKPLLEFRGIHSDLEKEYCFLKDENFGFNWCTYKEFSALYPDFNLKEFNVPDDLSPETILQFYCDC